VIESDETVVESATSKSRAHTASKKEQGIHTPKRLSTGRRSGGAPVNRRELAATSREQRRNERVAQREAMMRGEERALLPRDKGPERALVRDIVDSRRNASSYFFYGLLFVLVLTTVNIPVARLAANAFFVFLILVLVIDGFLLSRRVKSVVQERLPKLNPRWGSLYFYAVMRATSFRRMRVPRPRVQIGGKY
jgi:hypothetical protein